MIRRMLALALALLLLSCGAAALADVADSMQVYNCQSWVSLRERPSTSSAQLARVPLGEWVSGCEEASNGFIKCEYGGQTGYILAKYLQKAEDGGHESEDMGEVPGVMHVVNCQSWVSLRGAPSTSATQIYRVPLGATVEECVEASNGFVRCNYDGWNGYILASYLRPGAGDYTGSSRPESESPTDGIDMRVVNCQSWVSLRKLPSTSSTQLARVPLGAVVSNCSEGDNGFKRCEYNGRVGYILSSYLERVDGGQGTSEPEPTPAPDDGATPDSGASMYVVNCQSWVSLRSSASTSSAQLARVPLGAQVTNCIAASNGFVKCSYGGRTGYILAKYLSEARGSEAASASGAIYDGVIGEYSAAGYRVTVERGYLSDYSDEFVRVRCYSSDGSMLWEREANSGTCTELDSTDAFIGGATSEPRVMLYVAGQGLRALDLRTGEQIWLLTSDEVNLGSSICWAVDDDGTMYIGGYYGPDPVAISVDGDVLWQSSSLEYGPYWLYLIDLTSEGVLATYDMNSDSTAGAQVLYGYDGSLIEYIEQ